MSERLKSFIVLTLGWLFSGMVCAQSSETTASQLALSSDSAFDALTEQASSRERNILTSEFGMPSVASNMYLKVELDAGRLESLKCDGLHFRTNHSSHGRKHDSFALVFDDNGEPCAWATICIASTYDDAASWFCSMLSRQSSMPLEMRIADMERIDGIGDFCIADKGINRKLAIFIRGNLAVCLRIEGKSDAVPIAREIDSTLQEWSSKKENSNLKPEK